MNLRAKYASHLVLIVLIVQTQIRCLHHNFFPFFAFLFRLLDKLFHLADTEHLFDNSLCKRILVALIFDSEQCSCMPGGNFPFHQKFSGSLCELQQTKRIRNSCATLADLVRHFFLCQTIVPNQHLICHSLFDRIQIRALHIFNDGNFRYLLRAVISDQHRNFLEPRCLRCAISSLTGDNLISPQLFISLHQQRL